MYDLLYLVDSIYYIALTSIGCYDDDIIEQILWTVRCDKVIIIMMILVM